MKPIFFGLIVLFISGQVAGQNGKIKGVITDTEGGEPVVGATVVYMKDSVPRGGGYSDEAGAYEIANVAPGNYTLRFTYVSYETKTIEITVVAGQTVTRNMGMGFDMKDTGDKNTVVITGRVVRNNEGALLKVRQKSVGTVDVLTLDQVKRTGDSDAGQAMARVTGVTVEGGKYVYVRGLGDRYSKTLLNGSEIPGLDPDRNSVQMDMFPSSLIDNLVVHKTFTPDLPASFSGGLVKVATKDFPEALAINYSSSAGYNTQSSFRTNFLSGQRGKYEWAGFDDGTRALPEFMEDPDYVIPTISFSNSGDAAVIEEASNAFSTPIQPEVVNSNFNHSHSFSIGNQKPIGGRPFGYLASFSYNNSNSFYENGTAARWKLTSNIDQTDGLTRLLEFSDVRATNEVLWGGLVNLSYMPSSNLNHQLRFNYMHNQSGSSEGRYMTGTIPDDDPNLTFETRVIGYRQRALDAAQLMGAHKFGEERSGYVLDGEEEDKKTFGQLSLDWVAAFTRSSQDEPDLRFFSNDYTVSGEDTIYDIQANLYPLPSRFFRNMTENNMDVKADFELPFTNWNALAGTIKFGAAGTHKDRNFNEARYDFNNSSTAAAPVTFDGDVDAYFAEENMGVIDTINGLYYYGIRVIDATELRNSYRGSQDVYAGYAMAELPLATRLRFITGARLETTDIRVGSKDPRLVNGGLQNIDVLPSATLIYNPNPKVIKNIFNLRGSYSRTLARPTFRELAPFASFAFVRDFVLIGNDQLERTLIDNFDLRWEMFPSTRELVSVSAFYKKFQNPIERVINPQAQNIELNYRNVPEAKLFGVEFEFRKSLGFMGKVFEPFRASGNLTLIKSQLDINPDELALIRTLNPEASAQREMFGQSPYTINGELAYINDSIGLTSSVNFNVFGPRIANVSIGGTPNVYEQPRPSLDFSIGKSFQNGLGIRVRARNLLNPEYQQVHPFKDTEFVYSSYTVGRTYSLSVSYTFQGRAK